MINRSAVLIRPRKPYLDWAESLDDAAPRPDPYGEPTIYLIPEYEVLDDGWKLLEECFPEIFERELWAWHRDEADWPESRDFEVFKEWFEIEFVSELQDLCDFELIDDSED